MICGDNNPFYRLLVSPTDGIESLLNRVTELEETTPNADYLSLFQTLITPESRIEAELSWFPDLSKENYSRVISLILSKELPIVESDVKEGTWDSSHYSIGMDEEDYEDFRKYKSKYYNEMYDHGGNNFSLWASYYSYPSYAQKPDFISGLSEVNYYRYIFGIDYKKNILKADHIIILERAIQSVDVKLVADIILDHIAALDLDIPNQNDIIEQVKKYLLAITHKASENFACIKDDKTEIAKNVLEYVKKLRFHASKEIMQLYEGAVRNSISDCVEKIRGFVVKHDDEVEPIQDYISEIKYWSSISSPIVYYNYIKLKETPEYLSTIEIIKADIERYTREEKYDAANELSKALCSVTSFYPAISGEIKIFHEEKETEYRNSINEGF